MILLVIVLLSLFQVFAQCATNRPELYTVRVGSSMTGHGGSLHKVVSIKQHENYLKAFPTIDEAYSDLALFKVSPQIELGRNGAQIRLPTGNYVVTEGRTVSIAGWGSQSSESSLSLELRRAKMRIVNSDECSRDYGDKTGKHIRSGHQFCASRLNSSSCCADSGGPLVTDEDLQVGIDSWGIGCADHKFPKVYVDVAYYRDWIEKNKF